MHFPVPSPRARFAFFLAACGLAGFLTYFGLRHALAAHFLQLDTRAGYLRAVHLEPGNPRNWFLLGRSYLYDFEQPDTAQAVAALRKAVALDPYSSEALIDLAAAYESQNDIAAARQAFLTAQHVYPLSADVAWSYGNFLLRQGDAGSAFREIRSAVELDPKLAAEAFSRALLVQPDANIVLDQALPSSPAIYLPILHSLSDTDDMVDAQLVWNRLLALHQAVPVADMVVFIDSLLHDRRSADAYHAWLEAVSIMQNPPPPDPPGSIIWDGSFESGYHGGGFAWRFTPQTRDAQISFDGSEKHSGNHSLRILFNGHRNINFEDACHNIAPTPGMRYLLSAWVKTQSLTSSEGVRLQIFVFTATGTETVITEEVHGTQSWKQIQLPWLATSGYGTVCVKRNMSDMPDSNIQGAAWLDDVAMVPTGEDSPKP